MKKIDIIEAVEQAAIHAEKNGYHGADSQFALCYLTGWLKNSADKGDRDALRLTRALVKLVEGVAK